MRVILVRALLLPLLVLGLLWVGCAGDVSTPAKDSAPDGPISSGDGPTSNDLGGGPPPDSGSPPQPDTASPSLVDPPLGGSSGGSGGDIAPMGQSVTTSGGTSFNIVVPSTYQPATPSRLMIVFSGTEGANVMTQNLLSVAPSYNLGDVIFAVLDGTVYFGNGQAGAAALDHVRAQYNVDNDRTLLLSESAGTSAGLQLGLDLKQSYFAAYWANDVNASATPSKTAAQLGFAPWGNAGPGGQLTAATAIVDGMKNAGYRLPADAPYSGAGSTQHGSVQQFLAALSFFAGKSRN